MHRFVTPILAAVLGFGASAGAEEPDTAVGSVTAAPEGAISGDLTRLSDDAINARIAFLSDRLDDGEQYATYWQYGFVTAWSLGVVIGSLQAGLTDNPKVRANGIVTAAKAAFGVTRLLLQPQPGMLGARPISDLPGETREQRMDQLRAGEEQLADVAHRSDERYRWLPHLGNLGTNLAGMGVLFATSTHRRAIESAAVGIFMGEVMIWSSPWRGAEDLTDYERSFDDGLPSDPEVTWQLIPTRNGAAIFVQF